jgi:hypothetical protein
LTLVQNFHESAGLSNSARSAEILSVSPSGTFLTGDGSQVGRTIGKNKAKEWDRWEKASELEENKPAHK